jgi:transcriptional regulator with XRE-family HTH domain
MDTHKGQIIEYVVRKKGYSVTKLAALMNVNRQTIYNWFQQKYLRAAIIYEIGLVIQHDFTKELPELSGIKPVGFDIDTASGMLLPDMDHWKDKYSTLLERYNEMLLLQQRERWVCVKTGMGKSHTKRPHCVGAES